MTKGEVSGILTADRDAHPDDGPPTGFMLELCRRYGLEVRDWMKHKKVYFMLRDERARRVAEGLPL